MELCHRKVESRECSHFQPPASSIQCENDSSSFKHPNHNSSGSRNFSESAALPSSEMTRDSHSSRGHLLSHQSVIGRSDTSQPMQPYSDQHSFSPRVPPLSHLIPPLTPSGTQSAHTFRPCIQSRGHLGLSDGRIQSSDRNTTLLSFVPTFIRTKASAISSALVLLSIGFMYCSGPPQLCMVVLAPGDISPVG